MSKNANLSESHTRFIYDPITREKYPCSEEVFQSYYADAGRIRKREQYHQRCMCPRAKWWMCNGDCLVCRYHAAGDTLSLDAPNTDDGKALFDTELMDPVCMEDIVSTRLLLEQLLKRLRELDPDADRIIRMWTEDPGISDRAIAEQLGRPQRTFADQMKKYRTELRKIRGY